MTTSACPICGGHAEASGKLWNERKFDCPSCGVFRITDHSMIELSKLTPERRGLRLAEAMRTAKAGALPLIHEV